MTRKLSLVLILISLLVIAAGYASAFLPGGAPRVVMFAFAVATASVMTAIMMLGAARKHKSLGALKWVFAFTFIVLAGGFCWALTETAVTTTQLWLGLPRGAAIILYVVGLLPMAVLPIAYALTFEQTTLDPEELAQLRQQLSAMRSNDAQSGNEVLR